MEHKKIIISCIAILQVLLLNSFLYSQGNGTNSRRFQQRSIEKDHAFSGTMVLSLEGGATMGMTDFDESKPVFDYAAKGSAEYFFPSSSAGVFGLRVFGGGGYLGGKNAPVKLTNSDEFRTSLVFYGGGLVYSISLGDVVFPYVFAGVSLLNFTPKNASGSTPVQGGAGNIVPSYGTTYKNVLNYNSEIGMRILLAHDLSFNINAGIHLPQHDRLDGLELGVKDDLFFTAMAGFSISFFGSKDNDKDGINNSKDNCPDSPEDFDGFQDEDGCPDMDNDKDHVFDEQDRCINQPEDYDGFKDDDGCPDSDNDADGILDTDDRCPNQAEDFDGFEDTDGCPDNDNDNDGILDQYDKCVSEAENYNGYQDEDGCPDERPQPKVEVPQEMVLSAGTNFMTGRAELLAPAYPELDKIVRVMKQNPNTRWRIEGHTDNTGSDRKNRQLSLQRAQSVLNYFLGQGLDRSRFEVYGMGKDVPVADNTTPEGRAKNRRVVILRIN